MKLKFCGLTRKEDIEAANEIKPDFIGFVFAESRRHVSDMDAARLKEHLDPEIKTVGVFVNDEPEHIAALVRDEVIDIIQLHGGKAKYALFPVWLLSTSWRGENYLFAMNGQTGRFVGDLPVDKGAARKWMLGLTAALSAASYGVMWLLWLARIL